MRNSARKEHDKRVYAEARRAHKTTLDDILVPALACFSLVILAAALIGSWIDGGTSGRTTGAMCMVGLVVAVFTALYGHFAEAGGWSRRNLQKKSRKLCIVLAVIYVILLLAGLF